jgi:peroxiredoxin
VQKRLPEFEQAGVRPVAISVDTPEASSAFRKRRGFTYTFLSDPDATTIRRYDLLHAGGGPDDSSISRPAEFLVDSSGKIRWVNFTEDFRVRARADEMLAVARTVP